MNWRAARMVAAVLVAVAVGCAKDEGAVAFGKGSDAIATRSRQEVVSVMRRVADWQLANLGPKQKDDWIRSTFYTGVMATYRTTGDARYLDEAIKWGDAVHWDRNHGKKRPDDLCCAQTFAEIALVEHDPKYVEKVRAEFDKVIAEGKTGRQEWFWCDTLFMAPPGMVRLAAVTGDEKYVRAEDRMWWDATDFLYDREEHLFFRDASFFDKKTKNGQKVLWSRGNGWVVAGTCRVLDYLPKDYPSRPKYVQLHREMLARLASLQGADGLWGMSLLDRQEYPMGETSGSAFFAYAMAWGINHGTLDRETYLPVLMRAWNALRARVQADGKLTGVQGVAGAPTTSLSTTSTAEYATGAYLLLCEQMAKL